MVDNTPVINIRLAVTLGISLWRLHGRAERFVGHGRRGKSSRLSSALHAHCVTVADMAEGGTVLKMG